MKLSNYYNNTDIARDGIFNTLGYVDSSVENTLAYCDTFAYLRKANENENISCIMTKPDLAEHVSQNKGILISNRPRCTFYSLHNLLCKKENYGLQIEYGIGNNCSIHPSAIIAKQTMIGNNVTISENAVIKSGVSIGDNTFIDVGVTIGSQGLLYIIEEKKNNVIFIHHAGGVEIGNNVTILSHTTIVKSIHEGYLTSIGDNSIIGISTNIGHEAQIGKNVVMSSNCVIARRAQILEGAWIGPSSVIREHIIIGKFAQVKLGSIVVEDVKENQSVSGSFAVNHQINLRHHLKLKQSLKK